MKSHRLSTYAHITLLAAVAAIMTACTSAPYYYDPDPYYSARLVYYDYWYYPAIGAYYDPRAHIYIYYEHDHWIRAKALPPRMRPHLGRHVTVRSPHARPHEEHHRHRKQYLPERYRKSDPAHRHNDVWIGAPRRLSPQRDRDDRRIENRDRDRNDKDRRHGLERGAVAVPPRYRERDVKYPRQAPDTRPKDTPRHREPPASAAPIKREDRWRQPAIRREKSREQYRSGDAQRNHEHKIDHDRPGSKGRQPGQYRAPESRRKHTKTPSKAASGHQEPSVKTVPVKPDGKRHQRRNHKEDTQYRYRERDDGRGNVPNDDNEKRKRNQYDQYEQ